MNESNEVPSKGVLKRKASVIVACDELTAYNFIASSDKLPLWLKKVGAIPGAKSVDELDGSYDTIGQQRKITFESGDTCVEQLLSHNPPGNYSYRVTDFSNFFRKLTNAAYGQLWFDNEDGKTRITWEYSFTYRNIFARMFLSIFLSMAYKKFLQKDLEIAKNCLEAK